MSALIFTCLVLAAPYDGDSWTCSSGVKVRAAGIDAPELHGCHGRRGRTCVPGDGQASKRALERMIAGQTLRCVSTGRSYQRTTAWCWSPRVGDVSCALVRAGVAVRWARYDKAGRLIHCSSKAR